LKERRFSARAVTLGAGLVLKEEGGDIFIALKVKQSFGLKEAISWGQKVTPGIGLRMGTFLGQRKTCHGSK
jgi:hypothetical protein